MHKSFGVVVASLFLIHCAAPVERGGDTPTPVPSAEQAPPGAEAKPEIEDRLHDEGSVTAVDARSAFALNRGDVRVTSTVRDDTGAEYVTGTFEGTMVLGDITVTSKGERDVFVLKRDPTGVFVWGRAIGSRSTEHSPHVRLGIAPERIALAGITDGEIDCGSGPMMPWSSETLFLCLFGGTDGASEGSGVFPTGAP